MAKVFLICGKICCGKTTYAQKLYNENNAVLLSVDEITLALFGQHCGDKHDEYVERTEKYLLNKSMEVINKDINVVSLMQAILPCFIADINVMKLAFDITGLIKFFCRLSFCFCPEAPIKNDVDVFLDKFQ